MQTADLQKPVTRRGLSTVWVILTLPLLLLLFCFLINVANMWLARVELENALEAAALAAVKEWGDAGGGSTLIPREIGQAFARENGIRCRRLQLGLNYDPVSGGVNENLACEIDGLAPSNGNLIFGAIEAVDPNDPIIFNAGVRPGCGIFDLIADASGQGSGGLQADNAWGFSLLGNETTPASLQILRIEIDLRGAGSTGNEVFSGAAVLSDNVAPFAVRDNSGNTQPDIVGFTNPSSQIVFGPVGGPVLSIDFLADGTNDSGFQLGDRFRFGVDVENVSTGNGTNDGDGIGQVEAKITVIYTIAGIVQETFEGFYVDNLRSRNDCLDPADMSLPGHLIVHPDLIPDVPCPPAAAEGNNGQSIANFSGAGGRPFAVRAQAMVEVPTLCGSLCGLDEVQCVRARVTAVYDCRTRRPRLIRIDEFICP